MPSETYTLDPTGQHVVITHAKLTTIVREDKDLTFTFQGAAGQLTLLINNVDVHGLAKALTLLDQFQKISKVST